MEDFVKSLVKEEKVVIFSKYWCPFWKDALSILESSGVEYKVYDVEEEKEGSKVYAGE